MGLVVPYRSTGVGNDYTEFSADIIGFGAGTDINVILGGVTFHLSGDGNNPHNRFSPMTATMEIVNDRDAVTDFISAMSSHTEEEFYCKIYKNGALVFIGSVTADGGEWQDLDRDASPTYKLIAYDGMGRMQGKNYADDSDSPYTDYATIPEIIFRCMEKTGTAGQFSGQPFFAIVHDNIEDSQAVSGDPLGNQRVDQAIFYEIGQDTGTYNYKTCQEVLEYIMVAYNLCLRYVGPYFLFYNPKLMTSGASAYSYSAGGSYSGTISVGSSITILDDKSLDANRKGISNFGALPPLYKARITYDHGPQDVNMLFGVSYEGDNIPTPGDLPDLIECGSVTVNPGEQVVLRFSGKLRTKSHYDEASPTARWRNHRYYFKLRLKVTSVGYDDTYWQRNHEAYDFYATTFSNYENPQWSYGVEEEYDWVSDIIDDAQKNNNLYKEIGFDTHGLGTGVNNVFFSWQFIRVFDEKEEDVLAGSQPVLCEWEFADLELTALEDSVLLKRPTKTVSEAISNYKNAAYLHEETIIGDGPGKTSLGRIQVLSGGEWKDSALWGGQKLHIKSVKEIAEARGQALKKLLGGFYALNAWFDTFVTYNSIIYWPLDVQYTSGNDDWEGIWLESGTVGGTITTKEKRVLRKEKVDIPLNPNRLPDDEELQWRITIPQTKEAHTPTGGPYTQLELRSPAPRNLWRKGDLLNITDPVIGWVDELTLTQDVLKDDTIIYFQSWTPSKNFPPGSYLELNKLAEIEDAGENVTVYRFHEGWNGSSINVIDDMDGDDVTGLEGILLPDEGHIDMTRAIYAKRVEVYKSGQKIMYQLNVDTSTEYHKGFYGVQATDTIHFHEPVTGQPLEIYIKKIYKED